MDEEQLTTAVLSAPSGTRELVACWEDKAERFDLTTTAMTIGRGDGCEVRLAHASVSRAHARLDFGDHGVAIDDLGSANGTLVDGVPLQGRAPLALGSIVQVGAVRLVLRTRGAPPSSAMGDVLRLVDKFAKSALSLVLFGETGVGKEVLTKEIHARSERRGPLVQINCAGLSATLIESELFGHERGAFTGATSAKPGLIEAANGGTLFFDELGEMPESTQPKLLRVLESKEVRRVGAIRGTPIDVRFVSATHRDLQALAVMGRFREDLLFRLNGFTLRVPPLRERREEVLPLAEGFLVAARARAGTGAATTPRLSEAARALLSAYRFPGNVRELRNVMERAALVCEGDVVLAEHLLFDPASPVSSVAQAGASGSIPPLASGSIPPPAMTPAEDGAQSLGPSERDRIARALAEAGGNQAAAAATLGITRRVLGYRMDKLGLPRPRRK